MVNEIVVVRAGRQLFRANRIFQYRLRGDSHSLFRERYRCGIMSYQTAGGSLLASYFRFLLIDSPEDFYKGQRRERRVPLEADAVGGRLAAVSRDESCQTQFAGKIMFG